MEKTSVLVQDTGGNSFGKVSRLSLTAAVSEDRTILQDVRFTAPYKIMHPFRNRTAVSISCCSRRPQELWTVTVRNLT